MQKIILIGRLGRDPEMRYTPTGQQVASFPIAVDQSYTGQDGAKVERTAWFRIQVWGKRAEVCEKYLAKGKQVYVEGNLQFDAKTGGPRLWQAQDETMRVSFEVSASDVQFLGSKSDSEPARETVDPVAGDDGIPF